jgi:hypothetical protein
MQRSPIVRLLMSQDRINGLGRQLGAELAPWPTPAATPDASGASGLALVADSRIAQLQDELDREARSSLVLTWLELSGPHNTGD